MIKQGSELRRGAQEAILALFNLNTPQVTMRFAQLPKEYQEAAATLIQGRLRKSSLNSGTESASRTDLSPEQVIRHIRKTTAEIQSYSYDGKVTDTASHDSGISQMSLDVKSDIDLLSNWTASMTISSPTKHSLNGVDTSDNSTTDNGITHPAENGEDSKEIGKVLNSLEISEGDPHKQYLKQLTNLIRETNCVAVTNHFKRLLRILLMELGSGDSETKALVLSALTEMMKKRSLSHQFESYTELLVLRVVGACSDVNKEVARHAEMCVSAIANILQSDLVIKVLSPLIRTGGFPMNLAAIKTLTKVIEAKPQEDIITFLPSIMPGLLEAYGDSESHVRKASVFCMVALHKSVGMDTLKPYLSSLNPSKQKLLHLYINRTNSQNSGSGSSSRGQSATTPPADPS